MIEDNYGPVYANGICCSSPRWDTSETIDDWLDATAYTDDVWYDDVFYSEEQ